MRANPDRFIQKLLEKDWTPITENDDLDVDHMIDHWDSNIMEVLDELAEKKARNVAKNKKIQFPPEVNEKLSELKEIGFRI